MFALLNFLAFAYQSWILEPERKVGPLYLEQDYPGLVVVGRGEEVAAVILPAAPSDNRARCVRIGPFPRETDADTVLAALRERAAAVLKSAEEGQVWVGHWVQVPDQGSRAAAEQARSRLQSGGSQDAYILPGEDFRLSLGVFRLRSSANRAVERATAVGLETVVKDRFQLGSNFWVNMRMAGDDAVQPGEFLQDAGQILRTETIPCESVAF